MAHWACTIKRALAVVIVIGVLAALAACKPQAPAPEVIRPVRTQVVTLGSADAAATYPGEVKPRIESRLGFRVGGKLIERRVDIGQTVKAGEVLARLDVQDLALSQSAAKAQLDAANTDLALAQADLDRYRDLFAQNFIGKAELDRRQATLDGARARQEQATASFRSQSNQAGYATLVADAPGVVTGIDAEVGQVVAAGAPVVRIARSAAKEVAFSVPEDRVDALRKVRRAQVTLWALPGRAYDATVREVAAAADPATRTYAVRLTLKRDDADVRLGMTAVVRIELGADDLAVHLPLSALAQRDGKSFVWVVDEKAMTVQETPVTLAGPSGTEVLIAQGLTPGQRVVTAGANLLQPGQKVKLLTPAAAAKAAP
jgi:RND family efflux transporter MFP subunit